MNATREPTTVGVVGESPAVEKFVTEAGGDPRTGAISDVIAEAPDMVIAIGEAALLEAVRAGLAVPTLPVGAGNPLRSVPRDVLETAIVQFLDGSFETVTYPVLKVNSGRCAARILLDAMLVTAQPARISEYQVWSGDVQVAQFRADGVALATPAGSQGYTRSCNGPIVKPGTDVVVVVPVAPFVIDEESWILPQDDVALVVERDETPVELLSDDQTVGTVEPEQFIHIEHDGELPIAVVAESHSVFG